jgi:3-isopropylmalate dehydrogenase
LLENAVNQCISAGYRSADIVADGQQAYSTTAIGDAVCREMEAALARSV